jgi:hypothetical protein
MTNGTDVFFNAEDVGKKVYRKRTYYTLCVEQDVLASNSDEADDKFLESGGINHANINRGLTEENNGVETYIVDANYSDSENTKLIGKVVYEDDEFAKEDGLVELDTLAIED